MGNNRIARLAQHYYDMPARGLLAVTDWEILFCKYRIVATDVDPCGASYDVPDLHNFGYRLNMRLADDHAHALCGILSPLHI